jgi:valyl-tRNA synthetase
MEIPKKYTPEKVEDKWYSYWNTHKFFHSVPDEREPYTVVIPPPNVTGVLHMGHMLNNTLQDVLVRRNRMMGKNACWVPGTDHASIATEAKVVGKLQSEGIKKSSLSREEFLSHAWEWKEKHGGIILEQLKKLGASCDWDRTKFTMDDDMYESVIDVFIDLYKKGLIYQGVRMVNWDPKALTALSDEEVVFKEVDSKLYHVRYKIEGEDSWVTIATTRPETILGDTAVCVHPADQRYKHLHGKKAIIPLVERPVPVIQDEYVDMEFGTGCLKVTPAHDENDYNIGIRHKLDTIDLFNDDGTMSDKAQHYIGEDRFVVRDKIAKDLEKQRYLIKTENYRNKVGFSERTDVPIEPKLSLQWFVKMQELAKPALDLVMDDTIHFHPAKFKNSYRHWMENVRDWCISRQLWWGQRIPVYYLPNREHVVAKSKEEALVKGRQLYPDLNLTQKDLKQDEDVLDTWFSSWLWPISVFDGIRHPDNEEIKYYYPTDDLVTAPEILFFWVARMIMAGKEYRNDVPFKNVYLTGIVRDKQGRKMSKSLGNSPDPLRLISDYGADGVRVGMLFTSPAGNDLPFDEVLCEQGRNFSNKIWNALRLIKGWEVDETLEPTQAQQVSVEWFTSQFNKVLQSIEEDFSKFRISNALMSIYRLIWDDFCSWHLEMIKPPYQAPVDRKTLDATVAFFDKLMRVLHPFMPFLTEEVWQRLKPRQEGESIMVSEMPQHTAYDENILEQFAMAKEIVMTVRQLRQEKNIPQKNTLTLYRKTQEEKREEEAFDGIIRKLCNLESFEASTEKTDNAMSFIVRSSEFFIPLDGAIDMEAERKKLEEELKYTQGFLTGVEKKLSNERFVSSAPAQVVEREQKKKADAEARIHVIKEQLKNM